MPRKMSLIGSVAFDMFFYVQFLLSNFCLNAFQAEKVLRSLQYLIDSVCIWTVMMKRMRKSPTMASSKYPTFLCLRQIHTFN